jgi:hypothetical protein
MHTLAFLPQNTSNADRRKGTNVSEKYRLVPLVREVREISSRFVLVSELLKSV